MTTGSASRPVVLVLAGTDDQVVADGERLLTARGARVHRFDARRFPGEAGLTLRWHGAGPERRTLVLDGDRVDLATVDAVWHRRAAVGRPAEIRDARARTFAELEAEAALHQLWLELGVPFVPAPRGIIQAAQDKLRQLTLASALGLTIPPSLVTTDPDELLAFHREHGGRIITKLLQHASMDRSGLTSELMRFTEPVDFWQLGSYRSARVCPVFAQAYVPKRLELRVTVVGDRVFAAEIHSQASRHGRHDWRKLGAVGGRYATHDLPDELADRCRTITRALGLRYGALDLVLTPEGQYVFLEINPAGEFHWIEKRTGLPITAAIVDLVLKLAAEKERPSP